MKAEPGRIVKSLAGHDIGRFMVVVSVDGDFAFVADGKERLLSKPKKKRLKHIGTTNTLIDLCNLSDKGLRSFIAEFSRNSSEPPKN